MPIGNITQSVSVIPAPPHRGVDVQTVFVTKQEYFQDHLVGTTVTELNTFKDQLNARAGEINSTATTMNGYANTASAGASTATTKAGEASTSASEALTSRNQAETFKNNASASATKARQWADNNYNVEVETGKYSAKHWSTVAQNATANKVGKVISTDNAIVRFNGTTGDVQNSSIIVDDKGNIGTGTQTFNGFGGTGFKNYIINGNFGIWQRGTSQTIDGYGSADRWRCINSGTSTRTIYKAIATDADRPYFSSSGILTTTLTTLDTTNTGRGIQNIHPVEDVTRLSGKTVTLSFWARATVAMPIETTSQQIFGTSGSPSSAVVSNGTRHQLTTSWQKFSKTMTIPSIVGKTLGTDGVHTSATNIKFHLMGDSTTATSEGLTGTLQPVNGTTVFISEVQLEEGSVATPFENRPYGLELSLCQRYYETGLVKSWGIASAATQNMGHTQSYKVNKRIIPTVSFTNSSLTNVTSIIAENSLDSLTAYVSSLASGTYVYHADYIASAEL